MNCQAFDNIVSDLARNGPVEAALSQDGLDHASECDSCSDRLSAERSLSNALRNLAETDVLIQAPETLESSLLGAFRLATSEKNSASNVAVLPITARRSYHWSFAAAAAVVAALLAIAGVKVLNLSSAALKVIPQNVAVTPVDDEKNEPGNVPAPNVSLETKSSSISDPAPVQRHPNRKYHPEPQNAGYNRVSKSPVESIDAPTQEIATDYFPVSYASSLSPLESGRVIRVELPRTALASFGLPMNMAQANGSVKADVLMDDYGAARAIRFVR
ncbi:MAG: hypothetical protein QOH96_4247 [Blastocatellia bacterium]|nr:hypothetical protein [Blastocatellia bacterium]